MPETIPTKKKPVKMYAIQRKSDGKWSRGGDTPKWGTLPKTWGSGPFKNHLLQSKPCSYYKRPFPYVDCEVVEFEPETLKVINRYPANQWTWDNCYVPYRDRQKSCYRYADFLNSFKNWKKEYLRC